MRSEPTILYADIDAFFAQVEQVLEPRLRGKPVAVGGYPGERGVVACASYEARKLGLKTAMPLSQACRIAPQVIFLKGEYQIYSQFSARFNEILLRFTPLVEMISQDEAVADIGGSLRRFGSARALAEQVKKTIYAELGLTISVGVGINRYIAKIGSEYQKPDGLTVVMPGDEERFLASLPVEILSGVGPRTRATLNRLGIYTIGDLSKISPHHLEHLFGKRGREIATVARERFSFIQTESQPKSISRGTSFLVNSTDRSFLLSTLFYLLERACLALRRQNKMAYNVSVAIRYSDYTYDGAALRLRHPAESEIEIYPAVCELFQRLYTKPDALSLVSVALFNLVPNSEQLRLFPEANAHTPSLTGAIDRVRARFGYHSLLFGRMLPLRGAYPPTVGGFILRTPSLSR